MEEKEDSKGIVDKVVNDLSKSSITKQILFGATAGWFTGFVTVRVGKAAAFAVGGSVLLLQVAHHQGYIKVNWDKVYKHVDKVADKVEKEATGQSPKWMEKVERYVDRKLDKAEDVIKKKKFHAHKWYHSVIGHEEGFQLTNIHVFFLSFVTGVAIGIATTP